MGKKLFLRNKTSKRKKKRITPFQLISGVSQKNRHIRWLFRKKIFFFQISKTYSVKCWDWSEQFSFEKIFFFFCKFVSKALTNWLMWKNRKKSLHYSFWKRVSGSIDLYFYENSFQQNHTYMYKSKS
jgi:hypothetical protein